MKRSERLKHFNAIYNAYLVAIGEVYNLRANDVPSHIRDLEWPLQVNIPALFADRDTPDCPHIAHLERYRPLFDANTDTLEYFRAQNPQWIELFSAVCGHVADQSGFSDMMQQYRRKLQSDIGVRTLSHIWTALVRIAVSVEFANDALAQEYTFIEALLEPWESRARRMEVCGKRIAAYVCNRVCVNSSQVRVASAVCVKGSYLCPTQFVQCVRHVPQRKQLSTPSDPNRSQLRSPGQAGLRLASTTSSSATSQGTNMSKKRQHKVMSEPRFPSAR